MHRHYTTLFIALRLFYFLRRYASLPLAWKFFFFIKNQICLTSKYFPNKPWFVTQVFSFYFLNQMFNQFNIHIRHGFLAIKINQLHRIFLSCLEAFYLFLKTFFKNVKINPTHQINLRVNYMILIPLVGM